MIESTIIQTCNNLEKLSPQGLEKIAKEHLEYCNYKIEGYWDENDNFYETITFKQPLFIQLSCYDIKRQFKENNSQYLIKIKFLLKQDLSKDNYNNIIAEMTLIYDSNFHFIDENWLININSDFVISS